MSVIIWVNCVVIAAYSLFCNVVLYLILFFLLSHPRAVGILPGENSLTYQSLVVNLCILTLIRAAGGVYDFRNFEEVYLCNGLKGQCHKIFHLRLFS